MSRGLQRRYYTVTSWASEEAGFCRCRGLVTAALKHAQQGNVKKFKYGWWVHSSSCRQSLMQFWWVEHTHRRVALKISITGPGCAVVCNLTRPTTPRPCVSQAFALTPSYVIQDSKDMSRESTHRHCFLLPFTTNECLEEFLLRLHDART